MKKEYKITISAIVSVDDEETLNDLVIGRLIVDKLGIESISLNDDEFKVIEYTNNTDGEWLETQLLGWWDEDDNYHSNLESL